MLLGLDPVLTPTCCTRWPPWATAIASRWWTPTILPRAGAA